MSLGRKKKLIKFRFVLGTFQQYSKLKIRSSGFPSRFTCGTICKWFTYQKVDYILPHVYEFFVLLNFSHAIVKLRSCKHKKVIFRKPSIEIN